MNQELESLLGKLEINFELYNHPAVYSAQDIHKLSITIPGADTKNLLLSDNINYFLVVIPLNQRLDLKKLSFIIGTKRLSFAKPEILQNLLGVEPGSVSVLGLFHDQNHQIQLLIEESIWEAECWQSHPLDNQKTLVIKKDDYLRFFQFTGHTPRVLNLTQ